MTRTQTIDVTERKTEARATLAKLAAKAAASGGLTAKDTDRMLAECALLGLTHADFEAMTADAIELIEAREKLSSTKQLTKQRTEAAAAIQQHIAETDQIVTQRRHELAALEARAAAIDAKDKARLRAQLIVDRHRIEAEGLDLDAFTLTDPVTEDVCPGAEGAEVLHVNGDTLREHRSRRARLLRCATVHPEWSGRLRQSFDRREDKRLRDAERGGTITPRQDFRATWDDVMGLDAADRADLELDAEAWERREAGRS